MISSQIDIAYSKNVRIFQALYGSNEIFSLAY